MSGDTADSTYGINNLVGGWGAADYLTTERLKRRAVALHCPDQWLTDTLV